MLTITFSFIHWVGFDMGVLTQFVGSLPNRDGVHEELYKINNYFVNFGVISIAFVGMRWKASQKELDDYLNAAKHFNDGEL